MSSPIALRRLRAYSEGSRRSDEDPLLGVLEEDPLEMELETGDSVTVLVGQQQQEKYPPNVISNAKYSPWSFLPVTLYNEFSFFFNMYFLLVALSQVIPALRIGYLSTYIVPLAGVLTITLGKEAYDDIERRKRDAEANAEPYTVLGFVEPSESSRPPLHSEGRRNGKYKRLSSIQEDDDATRSRVKVVELRKRARDIKVGDILKLEKNQRVPADVVILKSYSSEGLSVPATPLENDLSELVEVDEASGSNQVEEAPGDGGETFIRTDQLDGETDWKLRLAPSISQNLDTSEFQRLRVVAGPPDRKVNEFFGAIELLDNTSGATGYRDGKRSTSTDENLKSAPLSIDNTAWSSTVVASTSTTLAVVVYTGTQTRQALSTAPSRSKVGLLEFEINSLSKILCALTFSLAFILVAIEGFKETKSGKWYVHLLQFLVLFSSIIPISLRVNVDMGKTVYARFIERDPDIAGAVVRTSTIPEELGRIEYLLSDKTGTLTRNEMELKKVHVGTVSYANEAMDEVRSYVEAFSEGGLITPSTVFQAVGGARTRREIGSRVRDVVLALALCHNVTPSVEEIGGEAVTSYQASSPDEIAIIKWTESVGLKLVKRDRKSITLECGGKTVVKVKILDTFPFTSESKRMGIIVHFYESDLLGDEIWFYQKGADTVMSSIVAANDWLDEETINMAREGLRTLVVGRRKLSPQQYRDFATDYKEASLSLHDRDSMVARTVKRHLEQDLELLGITGVEDKLQDDVKPSLELLRNAGIKIWMLTGDKVETARCVAISAKLVSRGQYIHTVTKMKRRDAAQDTLDLLRNKTDACLLIDGESLSMFLSQYQDQFISVAVQLPAVIACRCSPTQKADVAKLIRAHTKKRVCCIGDGGNDVSMIQAADVGVGIVGKEGRQASLAADFSIMQFCHLTKLLVWHGRNSYKRSAKLAQFIIHRGLIVSICQVMFSIASKFEPLALYRDWLLVGYATVYTMMPVFSLVLDTDVDERLANMYPELYKELTEGRSLSYRTFFVWVLVSVYQGCIIQGLSQILVSVEGPQMVAVSFTAIILNELIMVAIEITTWHAGMIFSILATAVIFFGSIPFLGDYYDLRYVITPAFVWRVVVICSISLIPPYAAKLLRRTLKPSSTMKLRPV